MKKNLAITFFLLVSNYADAFEPVNAFDDGFAIPAEVSMTEAASSYPGTESYINGCFVSGAWNVPYGVEELGITTGQAGLKAGKVGLSVSYSGSGFELYGDDQEKLGISFALLDGVSAGIRLIRNAMRIKGFGHAAAWSSDAGIVFHPLDSVFIGCAFEDIFGAELGETHEPLDGRFRFAVSWRIPADVTFLVSATKVRRFDPSVSAGFIAELGSILSIGVIGANEPDRFEFLCGVKKVGAVFSYRGSYHRDLGMSHGFSISWSGE